MIQSDVVATRTNVRQYWIQQWGGSIWSGWWTQETTHAWPWRASHGLSHIDIGISRDVQRVATSSYCDCPHNTSRPKLKDTTRNDILRISRASGWYTTGYKRSFLEAQPYGLPRCTKTGRELARCLQGGDNSGPVPARRGMSQWSSMSGISPSNAATVARI